MKIWKSACVFTAYLAGHGFILGEGDRLNILFVFAHDWGCYSTASAEIEEPTPWNKESPTPQSDRLAKEGALFRNAFVNSPQSPPSRCSLFSAQYFYRTGLAAVRNGIWDYPQPSFAMLLRDAGNHVGYSSKDRSPVTPKDAPMGGTAFEYRSAGAESDQLSQYVYQQMEKGVAMLSPMEVLFDKVRCNFDAFLADRKDNQPFLDWFGPRNPHREWNKGPGEALWGIDPERQVGKMPPFLPVVPEVREDLADYLGQNLAFDKTLGVLMERLEEIGALENTMIIVSGDHGAPGFTDGKFTLDDFGTRVGLAIRWDRGGRKGRVIDDILNRMDLDPTLLDAGKVPVLEVMNGKSILPLPKSTQEGQIDPAPSWVVMGRERHVSSAREGRLPYLQRAWRTKDWLYVINFRGERYPIGNPWNISGDRVPTQHALEHDTFVTYGDMDGGSTEAFLVLNHADPRHASYYREAFSKRPREELYDLKKNPNQMQNLAADPRHADVIRKLNGQLLQELLRTGDPRFVGDGSRFDRMPYTFSRRSFELDPGHGQRT